MFLCLNPFSNYSSHSIIKNKCCYTYYLWSSWCILWGQEWGGPKTCGYGKLSGALSHFLQGGFGLFLGRLGTIYLLYLQKLCLLNCKLGIVAFLIMALERNWGVGNHGLLEDDCYFRNLGSHRSARGTGDAFRGAGSYTRDLGGEPRKHSWNRCSLGLCDSSHMAFHNAWQPSQWTRAQPEASADSTLEPLPCLCGISLAPKTSSVRLWLLNFWGLAGHPTPCEVSGVLARQDRPGSNLDC